LVEAIATSVQQGMTVEEAYRQIAKRELDAERLRDAEEVRKRVQLEMQKLGIFKQDSEIE
jgi:hypothetical protein